MDIEKKRRRLKHGPDYTGHAMQPGGKPLMMAIAPEIKPVENPVEGLGGQNYALIGFGLVDKDESAESNTVNCYQPPRMPRSH